MICFGLKRMFGSLTWTKPNKGHEDFAEVWRGFVRLCDVGSGCRARFGEASGLG